MWLVSKALSAVTAALAKVDREGEGGGTRRDVDGSSSSEVETTQNEGPTIGVPCPASNGIIDNGCPYEDEDKERAETTAFGDGTNGDHGPMRTDLTREDEREGTVDVRDASEHALVDAEHKGRELVRAHGGLIKDALEAKVFYQGSK